MSMTSSPHQSSTHLSTPRSRSEERSSQNSTRKMASSTGGGRAWSEQEENYLIETRQHKMPYKHIAAHLQKTELACRLHYHQLSFGTKRRRRGSSASSARSIPQTANSDSAYMPQRQLPALSPPDSPGRVSRANSSSRASSPNHPVTILPKPILGPQPVSHHGNSLRLLTQDVDRMDDHRINKDRLLQIYDAHRGQFWNIIAQEYGDNVHPFALEDAWRKLCASQFGLLPPTPPSRSPHTPDSRPVSILEPPYLEGPLPSIFAPVNIPRVGPVTPPRSSFAISSLLT